MQNYATKEDLEIYKSDLAAKKECIAFESEVHKLDNNKVVNVSTSLNNLKTNVANLNVSRLKTVPVDLKN